MAITNARMQIKRGNEVDFDAEKMLVGEWALSTDKRIVRICVAPNTCIRMATYDAFEVDMAEVQKILEECQSIEEAVTRINEEVSNNLNAVIEYVDEARQYRDEAKQFRDEAKVVANVDIATTETAGLVKPDGTTIRVDADGTIHADNGTVDYNELENKPQINSVELSGNKSLSDLGIASKEDLDSTNATVSSNSVKIEEVGLKVDTIIEKAELNIKNNASGENIHLTDSANGKNVGFGLYGKAEQKQYSGKNLLQNTATTQTINGVTFTVNSDGSVTVNGTATANADLILESANDLVGKLPLSGSIILSGCSGGGSQKYFLRTQFTIDGNKQTIDCYDSPKTINYEMIEGGSNYNIYIRVISGVTVNTTFYPMISIEGGEYEPYVGGIASPNPDYPQEITVAGASYNLLENMAESQTINDVSIIVNDDKSIKFNGTASKNGALLWGANATDYNIFLQKGNYILSAKSTATMPSGTLNLRDSNETAIVSINLMSQQEKEFTIQSDVYCRAFLNMNSGNVYNNVTIYPMIRKASVKNNRYMPYGVGSVEVVSCGKNLFPRTYSNYGKTFTTNGVEFVFNNDGSITATGTATATINLTLKAATKASELYKYNGCILSGSNGGSNETYLISLMLNQSPWNMYGSSKDGDCIISGIPNDDNVKCVIILKIFAGVTVTNQTFYPMIRLASDTDDTYEPYKESTITVPTTDGLCGIKVSSGGNYTDENGQQWITDEIVKYADGSGKKIQRVGKVVFDGSDDESWYLMETNENTTRFIIENIVSIKTQSKALSNIAPFISGENFTIGTVDYCCFALRSALTGFTFRLPATITTVAELRTFLATNNAIVYYCLAEPIITDLTAEEIAEIEKLHTFYPITNISNDSGCGMSVTYLADAKNYIDNRLALIESAMLNNI